MPLTATFDPGHNHFPSENIYFFMNDGNQRIRCGVSELALEKFALGMSGFDFAGWLCAPFTPGGADLFRLLYDVGTVGIMSNMGNHPYVVDVARRAGR